MGAKWLYQLRSAPGQQTSTLHLFDRFEALGAKKICKWKSQTTYYKRHQQTGGVTDKGASDVYIVQFPTDVPDKGEEDKVMEGGANLVTIWAMMNASSASVPLFDQRSSMTVEGWAYKMGDFVMRVGSVVIRTLAATRAEDRPGRQDAFKGAVLEVEYLPCADRNESSQLVSEFVDVYSQPDGPTAVQVSGFRPVSNIAATKGVGSSQSLHWQTRTREYANEHRAQQYVALFHAVMRTSADTATGAATNNASPAPPQQQSQAPQGQQAPQALAAGLKKDGPSLPGTLHAAPGGGGMAGGQPGMQGVQGAQGVAGAQGMQAGIIGARK